MIRAILLSVLSAAVTIAAEPAVQGRVVNATSEKPIAGASVRLVSVTTGQVAAETATDDRGAFAVEAAADGEYRVIVSKSGYVDLLPDSADQKQVTLPAKAGHNLQLTLVEAVEATGRVFDTYHRPVPGTVVAPMQRRLEHGRAVLFPTKPTAPVDDRGMYAFSGLAPGRYIFAALPPPVRTDFPTVFPVYYPSAATFREAEALVFQPGDTRSALNFLLFDVEPHSILGRIGRAPAEWTSGGVAIWLFAADGYTGPLQIAHPGNDHAFRFDGVPEGSYELVAAGPVTQVRGFEAVLGEHPRYGRAYVNVVAPETNGVVVNLEDGVPMKGRIVEAEKSSGCTGGSTALEPLEPVPPGLPLQTAVAANGGFAFRDLPRGDYRISVGHLKSACFLQQIRAGERTSPDRVIAADGHSVITLAFTTRASEIAGFVRANGRAARGATVIVAPAAPQSDVRPEEARFTAAGPDGHYVLPRIGPGQYRALAIPRLVNRNYLDPSFWDDHSNQTVAITVAPGAAIQADLPLVQVGEAWR